MRTLFLISILSLVSASGFAEVNKVNDSSRLKFADITAGSTSVNFASDKTKFNITNRNSNIVNNNVINRSGRSTIIQGLQSGLSD